MKNSKRLNRLIHKTFTDCVKSLNTNDVLGTSNRLLTSSYSDARCKAYDVCFSELCSRGRYEGMKKMLFTCIDALEK